MSSGRSARPALAVGAAQDVEHELGLLDRARQLGRVAVERRHADDAVALQPRRELARGGLGRLRRVGRAAPRRRGRPCAARARPGTRRRSSPPRGAAGRWSARRTARPRRARGRSRAGRRGARSPPGPCPAASAAPRGTSRAGSARPPRAPPRRRPRSGRRPPRGAGTRAPRRRPRRAAGRARSSRHPRRSGPRRRPSAAPARGGRARCRRRSGAAPEVGGRAGGQRGRAEPRDDDRHGRARRVGRQLGHAPEPLAGEHRVHHLQMDGAQALDERQRGGRIRPPRSMGSWAAPTAVPTRSLRREVRVGLQRLLTGLAGADAVGLLDRHDEDLPVADRARSGVLEDGVDDRLHVTRSRPRTPA